MGKGKKSTKKFVQKGALKTAIQKRRKGQKLNRFRAERENKGAGGKQDAASEDPNAKKLAEMDLDEFLDGGFEGAGSPLGSSDGEGDEDVSLGSEDEEEDAGDEDDDDSLGSDDDEEDEGAELPGDDEVVEEEDSESDDDDDDPVVQDNKKLKGEMSKHKAQLEALREKDPEFYAYLQQTDAGLLGFGDDDEEESESEEESEEEEGGRPGKKAGGAEETEDEQPGTSGRLLVTSAIVQKWMAGAKADAGLGAARNLLKAYRLACHYGDPEAEAEASLSSGMRISSSSVYNMLMLFMLREGDTMLRRLLGIADKANPRAEDLAKSSRWRKVGPLVKSYLGNSLHLLGAMTDPPLMAFTIRRVRASTLLFAPFRKLADQWLKRCLEVWGSSEVSPRLQAFLAIRQLAVTLPNPYMERCLRGVYRTFISNAKFVSAASAPHIAFMSTCCVELWGLDLGVAYQHAFGAIRQLAMALRSALNQKSKDSYKEVYSWQGVNCLELWAKLLGAHADKAELRPLVYPTTQLLIGAARLVPTPRYFPLRLRLVRALNRLSLQTGLFVPVAPLLLDMLGWSELHHASRGGSGAVPDLILQLRASKQLLKTSSMQEEVLLQILELLADHLAQWSTSIAFPEVAHVPLLHLRKFAKHCPVERFRRHAKQLVDAVDKTIRWVGAARDRVDFSPKDIPRVQEFLREEAEGHKSPLHQLNAQMAKRAAQRAAARAAQGVTLKDNDGADGNDESDDEELVDGRADFVGAGAAAGEGSEEMEEDGEEEEDEEEDVPATKRSKQQQQQQQAKAKGSSKKGGADEDDSDGEIMDMDEDEDKLEDYVLSDEEEEEEEEEEGADDEDGEDDGEDGSDDDDDDDEEPRGRAGSKKGAKLGKGMGQGRPKPGGKPAAVGQKQFGGKKPQKGGKHGGSNKHKRK